MFSIDTDCPIPEFDANTRSVFTFENPKSSKTQKKIEKTFSLFLKKPQFFLERLRHADSPKYSNKSESSIFPTTTYEFTRLNAFPDFYLKIAQDTVRNYRKKQQEANVLFKVPCFMEDLRVIFHRSSNSNLPAAHHYLGSQANLDVQRNKNIWQTELISKLCAAIRRTTACFNMDEGAMELMLTPDYTMDGHLNDYNCFLSNARSKRLRAKALLDFQNEDEDELDFKKNDILTILSMKDEHCWVGELQGVKGWIPAKFVELLDERSKQYDSFGDDKIYTRLIEVVREQFCSSFKQILEHGIKKVSILGYSGHPWLFIEEVALREVDKIRDSTYNRISLCQSYKLEEDSKVLTPDELLYSEQVLHLWFEILASCDAALSKWFHHWSILRSPGWVLIKCELRILSRFSFNLSVDWELRNQRSDFLQSAKDVRDMVVKHHLFSWSL